MIVLIIVLFSGCTGSQDITPIVKSLPEVQQFLNEHPNAKITVTYWSKDDITKISQEISKQCDRSITPVAMYKAMISEGDIKSISWINAENKILICSVTEGKGGPITPTKTPTPTPTTSSIPTPTVTVNPTLTPTLTPTPRPTPPITSASVELYGVKTDVELGENILLKLSAVNLITKPVMRVQLILLLPSGMSVTSSEFVASGAEQYSTTFDLQPGGLKDIEIMVKASQIGDFIVKGRVIYYFGTDTSTGEDHTLELPIKVRVPATPISTPQQRENSEAGVTITAVYLGNNAFDIKMDTHSGSLDYEMKKISYIRESKGNIIKPDTWDGGIGGHHFEGILKFPKFDDRAGFELVIQNVAEVKERVLKW